MPTSESERYRGGPGLCLTQVLWVPEVGGVDGRTPRRLRGGEGGEDGLARWVCAQWGDVDHDMSWAKSVTYTEGCVHAMHGAGRLEKHPPALAPVPSLGPKGL